MLTDAEFALLCLGVASVLGGLVWLSLRDWSHKRPKAGRRRR